MPPQEAILKRPDTENKCLLVIRCLDEFHEAKVIDEKCRVQRSHLHHPTNEHAYEASIDIVGGTNEGGGAVTTANVTILLHKPVVQNWHSPGLPPSLAQIGSNSLLKHLS
uniref:Uncharacterized protein n=1 Tax=Globodera rostochiensis TaxID=31243 RepID=A0A914I7N0_GLORO